MTSGKYVFHRKRFTFLLRPSKHPGTVARQITATLTNNATRASACVTPDQGCLQLEEIPGIPEDVTRQASAVQTSTVTSTFVFVLKMRNHQQRNHQRNPRKLKHVVPAFLVRQTCCVIIYGTSVTLLPPW